jgi:hypothetical protein
MHGPKIPTDDAKYVTPTLKAYANRIGAEQKNFRRWVIAQQDGASGYPRFVAEIKIVSGKTIECNKTEFAPTEDEKEAIERELAAIDDFPVSITTFPLEVEEQRRAVGAEPKDWFAILDKSRNHVVMCQQRIDLDNGTKAYVPWTVFSDAKWRMMEPDRKLPLWKPSKRTRAARIMVHEGAKPARFADWLVNSEDKEAVEARASHPWAAELKPYEHWGWIGGTKRPHDTDWLELKGENSVTVAADRDKEDEPIRFPPSCFTRDAIAVLASSTASGRQRSPPRSSTLTSAAPRATSSGHRSLTSGFAASSHEFTFTAAIYRDFSTRTSSILRCGRFPTSTTPLGFSKKSLRQS